MEFLQQALAAGFDIHHADGDHDNNDPENLVLIYSGDHAKLHRGLKIMGERAARCVEERRTKGQGAYEMRAGGAGWKEVSGQYGDRAIGLAKWYARGAGMAWPIPVPRVAPPPREAKPKEPGRQWRVGDYVPTEEEMAIIKAPAPPLPSLQGVV